jgi:gamma-glutamyl:cysteine ligase YbdK (ATP-grasp superfamily)
MARGIELDDFTDQDYIRFQERLHQHLSILHGLVEQPGFGLGPTSIGAELELSIVDREGLALPINQILQAEARDPRLQLELDRFNLEYNLTPVPATGRPFTTIENEMTAALAALGARAAVHGGRIVPVGILPTLRAQDLDSSMLTDLPRYHALSRGFREMRQRPVEIRIDGEDPLSLICPDITLEGANNSFQVHLRVEPGRFAAMYNAAQLATPLALAVGANSPTFLGHRLWDETRVALFKKTMDHRDLDATRWRPLPRVSFGHGWVRRGAPELFTEAVSHFRPLLPVLSEEESVPEMSRDGIPRLDELRLHQGTVWRWNRAIYDPGCGGHLRIELRALPAGPTPRDMVASAALLLGLTTALSGEVDRVLPSFPFHYAEYNFYRAAQQGLDARLLWPSPSPPSPREVPVRVLLRELLSTAEAGLASLGVEESEIRGQMGVIRGRLEMGITPARWQRQTLARLERSCSRPEALAGMLEAYIDEASRGRPVHEWRDRH